MKKSIIAFVFLAISINVKAQEKSEVLDYPEEIASFVGGNAELMKYLQDSIKYPTECGDSCLSGKVYIQFVIEKDGSVSNVKCIRGMAKIYDDAAIKCVENMPKWIPARQNGKPVRSKFTLPFRYRYDY